jgi:sugar O-acyltransferase (sialic acid O-acetyltransferase NeuD family)
MNIVIMGAGGHGRVVLEILFAAGKRVRGFLDDDPGKKGTMVSGLPVLGTLAVLKRGTPLALGIGGNAARATVYRRALSAGLKVVSAVDPRAVVSPSARIGTGVVIMPGAVVNAGAVLEEGVVVNTSASIDHDCHLHRFSQIWPGAHLAGNVTVGELSYVGTGAAVIPGVTIGKRSIVGAGAAVIRNVPDGVAVVGVPAKPYRKGKS